MRDFNQGNGRPTYADKYSGQRDFGGGYQGSHSGTALNNSERRTERTFNDGQSYLNDIAK